MNTTTTPLKIDFVSDVSCPWCAVGLGALEEALRKLQSENVKAELHFQPFELNPRMGPEGQDIGEHITEKYGATLEQQAQNRNNIRARGAEVGFAFNPEGRGRIWNTFDAHRLLHWAGLQGADRQRALKHALLQAYHGEGRNPGAADVLVELAGAVGLDAAAAKQVLDSGAYADEVRAAETFWQRAGINSVPAVVIDGKHLIQGGQPAEVFERALRQIAAQGG